MAQRLSQSISREDLIKALKDTASGKSLKLDGIITKLYKYLWLVIGFEYLTMIQDSISCGVLPPMLSKA
jgi:hypothetical protein